jgi:hypothetical protein
MKSVIFVEAYIAVNTKLTSKVPFLFGNFQVFKKIWSKTCNFGMLRRENVFFSPPSLPPSPTFPGKFFTDNGYETDLESLNSEFGGRGGAMKYVASIRGGGDKMILLEK